MLDTIVHRDLVSVYYGSRQLGIFSIASHKCLNQYKQSSPHRVALGILTRGIFGPQRWLPRKLCELLLPLGRNHKNLHICFWNNSGELWHSANGQRDHVTYAHDFQLHQQQWKTTSMEHSQRGSGTKTHRECLLYARHVYQGAQSHCLQRS